MFRIFIYILKILNFSFTTPPAKIADFCHLPLHRGGVGGFFDMLSKKGPKGPFYSIRRTLDSPCQGEWENLLPSAPLPKENGKTSSPQAPLPKENGKTSSPRLPLPRGAVSEAD